MSLRVLLADESSTIKKVMLLALQDFDVEVKAVPIGLDVLEVSRSFKPDIIFADVLLTKKNGYEVSAEIKADPSLNKTPVVLMWSGFMEYDEAKASKAHVNQRLEKPFDTETLRKLVKDLVPRLQSNVISNFLNFPNMPEIEEPTPELQNPSNQELLEEIDEPEEFQRVPLEKNKIPFKPPENDNWSHQDLKQFRAESADKSENYEDLSHASIALSSGVEEIMLEDIDYPQSIKISRTSAPAELPPMTELSHERLEQIMREQVREVLETLAWKILPDMAERIVREEIQKLMKDAERL